MDALAIIGFSFQLPQGVTDESTLWEMLTSGSNAMTEWPSTRLNIDSIYDGGSRQRNTLYARGGHFVTQDPAAFDGPFFSITAREAEAMDPQQRWAMETAYLAFENAGIPLEHLKGSRTGVFAASMAHDYANNMFKDPDRAPRMAATGIGSSILPNRLSWYYGLCGPSIHVDTACSGSLVALDLACQSLRDGNSSMALVIGTNFMIAPETSIALANMNFVSEDSVCWSFDHRANGYGRGEGVIAILVKPLASAISDGDVIRAIIRATGTNQDGRTPGLTNPSGDAQEQLIRSVYRKAGLDFQYTRYVEAHGTGTPTGDPIEMKAIGNVFRDSRSNQQPLLVGSIKANIGHLEAASGLAGVLKCILILEKGTIPRNALFQKINPDINVDFLRCKVPTENIPWPVGGIRRVSVNSFGFGGTNSHIIMDDALHYLQDIRVTGNHQTVDDPLSASEDARERRSRVPSDASCSNISSPKLLVWSAASEKTIYRMTSAYETYYQQHVHGCPQRTQQLAFTLATRRSIMSWRTFAIIDARGNHQCYEPLHIARPIKALLNPALTYIFTGQGAQYERSIGLELLKFSKCRDVLKDIDRIHSTFGCEWSVLDQLSREENVQLPEYSQPVSTALQIALVELMVSYGIVPAKVLGHSSGEIAAAYTIGALSLESACKVAYYRGQAAKRIMVNSPGAMLSVALSKKDVIEYLQNLAEILPTDAVAIACINSLTNCTLSGTNAAIEGLKQHFETDGIFTRKLNTGVAYHSEAMNEVANDYLAMLGTLDSGTPAETEISMVSSVTGNLEPREVFTSPHYWVQNLVSPVNFVGAIKTLADSTSGRSDMKTITDFVEIGPSAILRRPVLESVAKYRHSEQPRYHSILVRSKSALETSLALAGRLFCYGYPVSIEAVNSGFDGAQGDSCIPLASCPSYPFDRSHRYWSESRLSRDYRGRGAVPAGSFLGRRFHDWNPLEPRWRNFICNETMPWLADHVIGGANLFPAAGMLVMAMEAMSQTLVNSSQIRGYHFKEAKFLRPIVVGESFEDSTETMLRLEPMRRAFEKSAAWSKITIYAYREDHWTECFQAKVQVDQEESSDPSHGRQERQLEDLAVVQEYYTALRTFLHNMDAEDFYHICHELDHRYGESFRLLRGIKLNDAQSAALANIDVTSPSTYQGAGLPHSTVLDALIQLAVAPISRTFKHTIIPHTLSDTWIAADGWAQATTSHLRLLSTTTYQNDWLHIESKGTVMADDETVLCKMSCLKMAFLANNKSHTQHNEISHLLHGIQWRPHLRCLTPRQLDEFCLSKERVGNSSLYHDRYIRLEDVLITVLDSALHNLTEKELSKTPPSLRRYVSAMQHQLKHNWGHRSMRSSSEICIPTMIKQSESEIPELKLYLAVASKLLPILRGEIDPVEFIFTSELTQTLYTKVFELVCDQRLKNFLVLATHERPGARILEIGSGTGALTRYALDHIAALEKDTGTSLFSEYTFTDISPGFFDHGRSEFRDFADRMVFQKLDVNQDMHVQGFEPGVYDMIIAGSVLHATADLEFTLRMIRKLLKPGGWLMNLEMVAKNSPALNIVFGTIPDWWAAKEPWRSNGPLLTECEWDQISKKTGFSGNNLVIRDFNDKSLNTASLILTTAVEHEDSSTSQNAPLLIIIDCASSLQVSVANLLSKDRCVRVLSLVEAQEIEVVPDAIVVFLLEIESPFLATSSEKHFQNIQQMILRVDQVLWVSITHENDETLPFYSIITGLFRSLRSEAVEKRLVTLNIETQENSTNLEEQVKQIEHVLEISFQESPQELEYLVRDGFLQISRLVEEVEIMQDMWSLLHPQHRKEAWLPGPALKLVMGQPGVLDSLEFREDPTPADVELRPDEVEVESKAWALSFRDVFIALARLEGEDFGFECTGIVTRVGKHCGEDIKPGDRVCLTSIGSMCTFPRAPAGSVFKLPENVSFEQGVSAIAPGVTVYYALLELVKLQRGEKILIHSGAGGTGQMAIWIAKMIGAEIFTTVGSNDKRQLLTEFGIPEDHIFYSRDTSFAKGIMRATRGVGVDVVLNSISGEGLQASWECMAPFGRFVEIGKIDVMENSSLPMSGFSRNVSFFTVDLHHMIKERPQTVQRITQALMDSLLNGSIRYPAPLHVYPVSEIEQAFRYMQSGKNTGRIIIKVDESDIVSKFTRRSDDWALDENASYLVAGGLGGLGRSISSWMVSKGAKHLILPSRTGAVSSTKAEFVRKMRQLGVNVLTPRCDVSSTESLSVMLQDCRRSMPLIRGCINAVMVLQDSIFQNMSHAQWTETVTSKVQSSWNLHTLLPNLDFFVLLSSLSGILGSIAQSNYAAGCTFQDSLAHFRARQGQKAISIDIGWMRTIGIIAESQEYENYRRNVRDMIPLEQEELLAVLSIACSPSFKWDTKMKNQILVGMVTPAYFLAKGEVPIETVQRPLFSTLARVPGEHKRHGDQVLHDAATLFKQAESSGQRVNIVVRELSAKLARALSIGVEDVLHEKSLLDYGVDSLVAVELRNWIGKEFTAVVAVFDIMGNKTIQDIGQLVDERAQVKGAKQVSE
ncbi:fatty acid synthase S-acetyltransferase [Nemania abortiva]|nr:fatty acid synthase S-acetyltransferase [Nemania abortiva]